MLPPQKTRIVATIGPASESIDMLVRLIRAGMNVARLNFSHGDFTHHADRIARIGEAERITGQSVAILADLPGPKMRVGRIDPEPIVLNAGDPFELTVEEITGGTGRVSVTFERLPGVVKPGDRLYLNDGLIQLRVDRTDRLSAHCTVTTGGELRSRKGLNLPGIDLGLSAFTDHDRRCLDFALAHGVDAIGQSFVETAADVHAVRKAAAEHGRHPVIVAKIERAGALRHLDDILKAADGVMVARGDLGVEVPIEEIALAQKHIIARANLAGKPVITATQMLESMVTNRLPTRAEATDVANAVLDGTDGIMLSAESAVGAFPEEAVAMLSRIASTAESRRQAWGPGDRDTPAEARLRTNVAERVASIVEHALRTLPCAATFVPTRTGTTARMLARFKPAVWTVAFSRDVSVCQTLLFSYGIVPVLLHDEPADWREFARDWLRGQRLEGSVAMLVAGPSLKHPDANHRIEFMRIDE